MCTIYENDQQLLLHTVIIMASHQVIVTSQQANVLVMEIRIYPSIWSEIMALRC